MRNRRKLRNILLQPRVQFQYAFRFFVLSAVAIGSIQLISYLLIRRVVRRVLTEAGPDSEILAPVIDLAIRTELLHAGWMLPVVCVAVLVFTSRTLHRFIGPAVPIKRCIERLTVGDYGAQCRTRGGDELEDVVVAVNGLSAELANRHGTPERHERSRWREAGFSLIELMVVLTVIMIISMLVVAQFITAYDRSRQRGTLADLRTIVMANGTYSVDEGDYAPSLAALTPYYLGTLPAVDRWGYAWQYVPGVRSYALSSRGSDGNAGPAPPTGWTGEPFECDLLVEDGAFIQYPGDS